MSAFCFISYIGNTDNYLMRSVRDIIGYIINVRRTQTFLSSDLYSVYIQSRYAGTLQIQLYRFVFSFGKLDNFSEPCKALKFIGICKETCFTL